MKKLSLVLIAMLVLTGCSGNNDTSQVEIDVNMNTVAETNVNEPANTSEEGETNEGTETTENGDQSSEGTNEPSETDPEAEGGTSGDGDTETGTEDSSASSEGESEGDSSTEDSDETTDDSEETTSTDDEVEPEVPVDYTANITQPYDDVDYAPQVKSTSFESNPAIEVKGIFITANTAASSRIDDFVTLLNETELNALVIDVKNDDGYISFHSAAAEKYVPNANNGVQIEDMAAFMKLMKDNNIYTIARIVTFKSPQYAEAYPEKGISYVNSGKLYYADGAYWASPFDKDLWDYNVEVAKEAIDFGFNEIQFDYVRFPATGSKLDKSLDFKNPEDHSKTYAVQEFTKYAYEAISAKEAYVALDVFGWTATTVNDSGIGQHWEGMSNVSDYMCPMVYPSHYGPNIFGLAVPDANPYTTVNEAMKDAQERNANIETPAKLRPWLQAFTATWVKGYIPYRTAEIQAQIKACEDLGINDYIFWNASNRYTKGWFDEAND